MSPISTFTCFAASSLVFYGQVDLPEPVPACGIVISYSHIFDVFLPTVACVVNSGTGRATSRAVLAEQVDCDKNDSVDPRILGFLGDNEPTINGTGPRCSTSGALRANFCLCPARANVGRAKTNCPL